MRIAVVGAGGVGGNLGGRLARAGNEVFLIARGIHMQVIRDRGLHVSTTNESFQVQPALATADPAGIGIVDAVFVCVKAWQVETAAQTIRPLIGPETMVIPLQNGVEAPLQLARILGESNVLGGLCKTFSYIIEPGHIFAGDLLVQFGELDNRRSERTERLLQAFSATAAQAEIPHDIHVALWTKFIMINALSGIGAITRAPAGVWRSLPQTRQMCEEIAREVFAVAKARNVAVTAEALAWARQAIDSFPADFTASMQRDIMDGLPSELDYQNGAVVRFAHESGIAAPLNEFIYYSLLPQEMRARGLEQSAI